MVMVLFSPAHDWKTLDSPLIFYKTSPGLSSDKPGDFHFPRSL
jgi:hypothetical protein